MIGGDLGLVDQQVTRM